MVRLALSTYLMFVMLAGPWLCCCSVTHLVARQTAAHGQADGQRQKAKAASSCCRHQAPAKAAKTTPDRQNGDAHGHPGERPTCPCQEHPTPLASATPSGTVSGQELHRAAPDDVLSLPALTQADASLASLVLAAERQGGGVSPFLTADDLLHRLHILRC